MTIPLISFSLAILFLFVTILSCLGIGIFKKNTLWFHHRSEPVFLLAVVSISLALALGLVGYYGVWESWFGAQDLRGIRLNLLTLGIISLAFTLRHEIVIASNKFTNLAWVLRIRSWCYKNRHFLLISLLFAFIALALMAPMASSKVIFSINDHTSHIGYIVQAKMALEEGQFPIRVAPLENFGLRYPGFQFYSQFPYTLGGLIYKFLTPTNPYSAYKIILCLALWCGGIFIYRIGNWLTRSPIASMLGGVAYMSAPYFLNNIHARGAFTEAVAQGLLPIALFYTFQTFDQPKFWRMILGAIAWFCLATTHIITFVYSSLFFIILGAIFWAKQQPKLHWRQLLPIGISYGWAWLLALYFLAPVVLESKTLSIRKQIEVINPFDTNWMTPLANLISPASMPSEPTELGVAPTYGLHPAIGWIFLAAFGTAIYYHFSHQAKPANLVRAQPWITPLLSIFLLSVFFTWSPINIWNLLPKQLWVTQFTFRFLTHVMWSGALLTTVAIIWIFRRRLEGRHLIIGTLLIVLVSRPWLPIPKGTVTVDELLKEPYFRYSGALDYLYRTPVKALYGNAELRLSHEGWIPGYSSWDIFINRPLVLDVDNLYPSWLANESPTLVIKGDVPPESITEEGKLRILLDDKTMAVVPLDHEELNARISFKNLSPNDDFFKLKFAFEGETKDGNPPYIRLKQLAFADLPPAKTLLPVEKVREDCQQIFNTTQCTITMNGQAEVAQLPVLYYPRMLRIWVDNQPVTGFPTNYWDTNLVGIKLPPGKHQVRVKFMGLVWANWISFLAWLALIGSSLLLFFRHKNNVKFTGIK
ncbi:MAG: hypothetical protein RLZZ490_2094 [Cyanobacteriota bacterium]|jgi:hypothetical protein